MATLPNLPLDIQIMIMDRLPLFEYVSFALAVYRNLQYRHRDRFPAMTPLRLRYIRYSARTGSDPLARLPNELIASIANSVDRRTLMSWVLAHYGTLASRGAVPQLTEELDRQLYGAFRFPI